MPIIEQERIEQFWYTSSAHNIQRAKGFGFRAVSNQLDPTWLQAVCPGALSLDKALLKRLRNVNFAILSRFEVDGHAIIAHKVPSGSDHFGRPGNFFIHGLVGPAHILDVQLAARLWESSTWVVKAHADASNSLPSIAIEDLDLLAEPSRIENYATADTYQDCIEHLVSDAPQPLVIECVETRDGLAMLALASRVLSPTRRSRLDFSTSPDGESAPNVAVVVLNSLDTSAHEKVRLQSRNKPLSEITIASRYAHAALEALKQGREQQFLDQVFPPGPVGERPFGRFELVELAARASGPWTVHECATLLSHNEERLTSQQIGSEYFAREAWETFRTDPARWSQEVGRARQSSDSDQQSAIATLSGRLTVSALLAADVVPLKTSADQLLGTLVPSKVEVWLNFARAFARYGGSGATAQSNLRQIAEELILGGVSPDHRDISALVSDVRRDLELCEAIMQRPETPDSWFSLCLGRVVEAMTDGSISVLPRMRSASVSTHSSALHEMALRAKGTRPASSALTILLAPRPDEPVDMAMEGTLTLLRVSREYLPGILSLMDTEEVYSPAHVRWLMSLMWDEIAGACGIPVLITQQVAALLQSEAARDDNLEATTNSIVEVDDSKSWWRRN